MRVCFHVSVCVIYIYIYVCVCMCIRIRARVAVAERRNKRIKKVDKGLKSVRIKNGYQSAIWLHLDGFRGSPPYPSIVACLKTN